MEIRIKLTGIYLKQFVYDLIFHTKPYLYYVTLAFFSGKRRSSLEVSTVPIRKKKPCGKDNE